MLEHALPRILSPNLGCPLILSAPDLSREGFEIVLVCCAQEWGSATFQVRAVPSFQDDGVSEFSLDLRERSEITEQGLPARFENLSETRFLISTTLRNALSDGKARFGRGQVFPVKSVDNNQIRRAGASPRPTLYDLQLLDNGRVLHTALHAICVCPESRTESRDVRFIHLTDLHVAARNDLMDLETNRTVTAYPPGQELTFINFNDRLRRFIHEANRLANSGELDFVLALGDLVDFVNQGLEEDRSGENNWQNCVDILTGGGREKSGHQNEGLRVPIFTTTGNHDWRPFPYPPTFNATTFGLAAEDLDEFDYLYASSSEVVGKRISDVQSKIVAEGSPILGRSWWGTAVGKGLSWFLNLRSRVWTRTLALAVKVLPGLLATLLAATGVGVGSFSKLEWGDLKNFILSQSKGIGLLAAALIVLAAVLVLGAALVLLRRIGDSLTEALREKITGLIGIESGVSGLLDYFLQVNPYFNYAFSFGDCHFILMDSGHDAMTCESFSDEGGKKIRPLKIRDNILGGSPESMAFYPPNECYPYSQIAWLESALKHIQERYRLVAPDAARPCRIIVGLHAPPANLSPTQRKKADAQRAGGGEDGLLLSRKWWGGYDIHYGTINHYVSQFFYLCLGFRESALLQPSGPGIDLVLSGHVHWNMEFRLAKPQSDNTGEWHPQVFYGDFSKMVEEGQGQGNRWWNPLLLQTAACGPPSAAAEKTPYYRPVHIDSTLTIRALHPVHVDVGALRTTEPRIGCT
ncbi:MAG: metallophosphoesterase [Acidobacteriia bacterium]|nr:metallophosphoesterase [Terriglobia bacterium]